MFNRKLKERISVLESEVYNVRMNAERRNHKFEFDLLDVIKPNIGTGQLYLGLSSKDKATIIHREYDFDKRGYIFDSYYRLLLSESGSVINVSQWEVEEYFKLAGNKRDK